jgi:non-ribosomal peptide synthetase component E (peptide arylation enzyme)
MKPGESAPPGILVTFRRNGEQFAGLIAFALGVFLGAEPSKMATIGNRRDSWRIRVTHENLAALAEGAFDRLGDYENLIFEGKSYSSGELLDRARRAGSGLSKLGVEPGDRVVVLMANCPESAKM